MTQLEDKQKRRRQLAIFVVAGLCTLGNLVTVLVNIAYNLPREYYDIPLLASVMLLVGVAALQVEE